MQHPSLLAHFPEVGLDILAELDAQQLRQIEIERSHLYIPNALLTLTNGKLPARTAVKVNINFTESISLL